MSNENKTLESGLTGGQLPDELLDKVAGGYIRRTQSDTKLRCRRCSKEFWESELKDGYCGDCLDELHKFGIPPIL